MLENLNQSFPEARIDILVRKGNESLFDNHPFVGEVLIWKKKEGKYKSLLQILKQIKANRYDWVINVQRFGSTGFLTALSGAPLKSGFDKNPFSFLFNHRVPHVIKDGIHEISRNHALIEQEVKAPVCKPRLYPSEKDFEFVSQFKSKPYICMAPASVWFTKQFPVEGWVRLIEALEGNYPIYLLGAPSDEYLAHTILEKISQNRQVVNLMGKLSFLQSAALMKDAYMNYVNDSAPMHLCSAVNAHVTAVYCSTVPAFGYGPLSDHSHIVEVTEKLDCRPCGLHGHKQCPKGHFRCGHDIHTDQLLAVLN